MTENLSPNECMAARYLSADGYTTADIAMMFQIKDTTVATHAAGECEHEQLAEPVETDPLSGEEIRRRRSAAGLTQTELAERLNVSAATISQWERGETEPRKSRAREVRAALETPDSDNLQ